MNITVPYNFKPRKYQMPAWEALEGGTKRAVLVWHRRSGKDLFAINWAVREAAQEPQLVWHCLPSYRQGRKIIWDGMNRDGRRFLDYFPGHDRIGEPGSFVTRKRDDEMSLWLANGSKYQVVGADDPDTLVGGNPKLVIFSEFSIYESAKIWNLIRPILAENGGTAIFIFTSRGRNHGYKILKKAEENPNWFAQVLTVDDTHAIPMSAIEEDRESGMPEELIQQEYFCSFDAPLVGSYYGDLMTAMLDEGRICKVPYEPKVPVNTWWDLGIRDATSIWFHQQVGFEHRLIDFHYGSDVGLDHYLQVLQEKPYIYGEHIVPWDAQVREMGSGGKSRLQTARSLGVRMRAMQQASVKDGINAVRLLLPKTYIDEEKCEQGIEGLRQYVRQEVSGVEDPDGQAVYSDAPKRNWATHPADALRTGAMSVRAAKTDSEPKKLYPDLSIV